MKARFSPDTATRLEALAWWDWQHDDIHTALDDFRNLSIDAFLEKYEEKQRLAARADRISQA